MISTVDGFASPYSTVLKSKGVLFIPLVHCVSPLQKSYRLYNMGVSLKTKRSMRVYTWLGLKSRARHAGLEVHAIRVMCGSVVESFFQRQKVQSVLLMGEDFESIQPGMSSVDRTLILLILPCFVLGLRSLVRDM